MENIVIKNLTEEEFLNEFTRQENHFDTNASFDGCLFETFGEELDYVFQMSKLNRIVTVIEGDLYEEEVKFINELGVEITETIPNLYYTSGFHNVNRIGFFVLDKPYDFEFEVKVE